MSRAIFFLLLLSACIRTEVLVTRDDWTGADVITVNEREIFRDGDAIVVVRPVIVGRGTDVLYGVLTNVRRRDANGPKIERMTAFGRNLPYRRFDRLRTHCIDGCQKAELGIITLDRESFALAARTGLPLHIWGLRGRYDGTVPAEAFARVLARAQRS